jgi:uncharacterized protein
MKVFKHLIQATIVGFVAVWSGNQAVLAQIPSEKALLWEISGKGIKKPSYLYGTIHLTCPNQLVVSNQIKSKLNTTQQLYLEIDNDDPNLVANTLKNSMLSGGKTVKIILSSQDYAKANRFFQSNVGISLDLVGQLKPIVLMSMLYPSLIQCQPVSWEDALTQLAKIRKMEVLGLETIQEQFMLFDKIPLPEQSKMLMEIVNDQAKAKQEMQSISQAYKREDITALYKMVAKSSAASVNYETVLLTDRNRRWIPIMSRVAQQKPTFFAVGAGHLSGANGVITLLRKAGYTLKPILSSSKPPLR